MSNCVYVYVCVSEPIHCVMASNWEMTPVEMVQNCRSHPIIVLQLLPTENMKLTNTQGTNLWYAYDEEDACE